MTPRLDEAQEMNIKEMRRHFMSRNFEQTYKPRPFRYVWIAFVVGVLAAAAMHRCHLDSPAEAAYRKHLSVDAQVMSADYPITSRDWNAQQEASIRREYSKIQGVGQ